jgi:hypothetical protein
LRFWSRLRNGPEGFESALAEAARDRHARIRAVGSLEIRPPASDDPWAFEIGDSYLPLKKAAEAAGVSEAQAAEFVRRGLWMCRDVGGDVYARPAIVSIVAVRESDSATECS